MPFGNLGLSLGLGAYTSTEGVGSPITLTQPSANRIFQRSTTSGSTNGKGAGTVTVTVALSRAIPLVEYRLRKASDGSLLQDWTTAATNVLKTATSIACPNVPAYLGWFYIDLRADGGPPALCTNRIGMGVLIAGAGQSLMSGLFQKQPTDAGTIAGAGVTISDNGSVFCVPGGANVPTSWRKPDDSIADLNSAGAPELLAQLIALAGCNVGLVSVNNGGTRTSQWVVGQALNTALLATLDAAGGLFEAVWWFNGHSDSQNTVSYATYQANLTNIFNSIAAHNSFSSPVKLLTSIPYLGATGWGTNYWQEVIRRASYDWANSNGSLVAMFNDQEVVTDYTHQAQAGSVRMAHHAYRSLRPHFGAAHNDNGISLGAISKSGVNLMIAYTLPSGATTPVIAGDASKIFKVYQGGDRASPLAFDGTTPFAFDNTAKTLTLKLASDPGNVPLTVLPFGLLDFQTTNPLANHIYDDLTDGDGISYGRELLFTPNPILYGGNRDLTGGGSPTYGIGKFGNTLTQGYGTITAPATPGLGTGLTLDFWAIVNTPDSGSTRALLGSVAGIWVGVSGNDLKLQTDTTGIVTYSGVMTTGVWKHIRCVIEPGSLGNPDVKIYIGGVLPAGGPASFFTTFVANNPWSIRRLGSLTTNDAGAGELIDEVAVFQGALNTANFTAPTAAWVGNEANLVALYHLDGDLTNSAA